MMWYYNIKEREVNKMYKMTVWNDKNNIMIIHYGFKKTLMKKLWFYTTMKIDGILAFDVSEITPLDFSLENIKMCLTQKELLW